MVLCISDDAFLFSEVEPSYSGARIEGDTITLDFVKKMMDDFKNEKRLHRRYDFGTKISW